jgi:hypothetical protein
MSEGLLRVALPPLHPGQQPVAASRARFKVLAAGRRWGKTSLGVVLCLRAAMKGSRTWWVAPTYPLAQVGWNTAKRLARQIPTSEIREAERIVHVPGGGEIQVKSADNPDSLRGSGLDGWCSTRQPTPRRRRGQRRYASPWPTAVGGRCSSRRPTSATGSPASTTRQRPSRAGSDGDGPRCDNPRIAQDLAPVSACSLGGAFYATTLSGGQPPHPILCGGCGNVDISKCPARAINP